MRYSDLTCNIDPFHPELVFLSSIKQQSILIQVYQNKKTKDTKRLEDLIQLSSVATETVAGLTEFWEATSVQRQRAVSRPMKIFTLRLKSQLVWLSLL